MDLLFKYTSEVTLTRALKLLQNNEHEQFKNQIARKMRGLLILKDTIAKQKGHSKLEIYSGAKMICRCCDANPRRLIRLFKILLADIPDIEENKLKTPILSKKKQSEILLRFSTSILERSQSEEKIGPSLYQIMSIIGNYMHDYIHNQKLETEQISSIEVTYTIPDLYWEIIEKAVAYGLLCPNIKADKTEILPYKSGVYRIAYVLCPYFKLLPRKGTSRSLMSILSKYEPQQLNIFNSN